MIKCRSVVDQYWRAAAGCLCVLYIMQFLFPAGAHMMHVRVMLHPLDIPDMYPVDCVTVSFPVGTRGHGRSSSSSYGLATHSRIRTHSW